MISIIFTTLVVTFCIIQSILISNYIVSNDVKEHLKPVIVIPGIFLTILFVLLSLILVEEKKFSKPKKPEAKYQQIEGSIYRKIN